MEQARKEQGRNGTRKELIILILPCAKNGTRKELLFNSSLRQNWNKKEACWPPAFVEEQGRTWPHYKTFLAPKQYVLINQFICFVIWRKEGGTS